MISALASAPALAVQRYVATPLFPAIPTNIASGSNVTGINNRGAVTGTIPTAAGDQAYLLEGAQLTLLGGLGRPTSKGYALNDRNEITGYTADASGVQRAFLWSNGVMYDRGGPPGEQSQGTGIDNAGAIIGFAGTGPFPSFLHDGATRSFVVLPGYTSGSAIALGPGTRLAGVAALPRDASGHIRSVTFIKSATTVTLIPALPGLHECAVPVGRDCVPPAYPLAFNATGDLTGSAFLSAFMTHGFIYTTAGEMIDLGALSTDSSTEGRAINAKRQVVGSTSSFAIGQPNPRAVLYSDGAWRDLNELVISGLGADVLTVASGINDAGSIVANACLEGFSGPPYFYIGCRAYRLDPLAGESSAIAVPALRTTGLVILVVLVVASACLMLASQRAARPG
jgi:probable HAF family extracellular repeat protein